MLRSELNLDTTLIEECNEMIEDIEDYFKRQEQEHRDRL